MMRCAVRACSLRKRSENSVSCSGFCGAGAATVSDDVDGATSTKLLFSSSGVEISDVPFVSFASCTTEVSLDSAAAEITSVEIWLPIDAVCSSDVFTVSEEISLPVDCIYAGLSRRTSSIERSKSFIVKPLLRSFGEVRKLLRSAVAVLVCCTAVSLLRSWSPSRLPLLAMWDCPWR